MKKNERNIEQQRNNVKPRFRLKSPGARDEFS
jgi:hypothetical protein